MGFGLYDGMVQRLTISRLRAADEQVLGFKFLRYAGWRLFCHAVIMNGRFHFGDRL